MSAGTVDRFLKPLSEARYPPASTATKHGSVLRSEIPAQWSGTSMERKRGLFEIDTVTTCEKNRSHRNVIVAGIDMLAAALRHGGESRMEAFLAEVFLSGLKRSRRQPNNTYPELGPLAAAPLRGVPGVVPRVLTRGFRTAEEPHQLMSAVRVLWL